MTNSSSFSVVCYRTARSAMAREHVRMGADNGPERADFSATVFVVTEIVGRTADWDALSSTALKLMTWKNLRDLNSKGIAIGSHSSCHKDLLTLSSEEVVAEGGQARVALREKLDIDTKAIAFPWGRSNGAVLEILARRG